jgi:hypothetical protein
MKLLAILLLITPPLFGQVATIKLANNTFIVNAPSGRDWTDYSVTGFEVYNEGDTMKIDNEEFDKISYTGNFAHSSDNNFGPPQPGAGGCSCSYSLTPGDSIVFMFTNANHFEWRGELARHHGIADVYWNDIYLGPIDTYNDQDLTFTRNFVKDNLDVNEVYKFKIVITGNKNPASTGAYVVNHGFIIWKDAIIDPPDPDPCTPDTIYIIDTVFLTPKYYFLPDTLELK